MKKLSCLFITLLVIGIVKSKATSLITNHIKTTDTVHQKIKRPAVAMPDDELATILNAMRQKRNDAEKTAVLKEGVKDKGITVDQLVMLLNQFNTDESKLSCAEYAYPYTVNYKAFLKIQDLFGTEETKITLADFVKKYK